MDHDNIPRPGHACMNTKITYEDTPPRAGNHRPLWPAFGEYRFLPEPRWVHALEHGAAVFLYHPCADKVWNSFTAHRTIKGRGVSERAPPNYFSFLPPANEVWGKVMFLLSSVILSRGSLYDVTSHLVAWSLVPVGGSLPLFPCSFLGVSVSGPMLFLGKSLSLVPCSFQRPP